MVHLALLPIAALTLGVGHAAARAVPTLPDKRDTCYLHGDPRNLTLTPFDCISDASSKRSLIATNAAPVRVYPNQSPNGPSISANQGAQSSFNMNIQSCSIPSGQRSDFCAQATAAFGMVGTILSNLFDIPTVINVDINMRPFAGGSSGDSIDTLAFAGPELSIPLVGDDGMTRYYPSALVKQFGISGIQFTPTDISVTVNTNPPQNPNQRLYFIGDPIPAAGSDTSDFLSTVLHETLHGMGFLSYFQYVTLANNNIYRPVIVTNNDGDAISFLETIFDRYTSVKTQATQQDQSYISNSPVYSTFEQLAIAAVTAQSFPFASSNQITTYLESGLNPFRSGSSGSHVSKDLYQNGADFLMTWDDLTTGSLAQIISDANTPGLTSQQRQSAAYLASVDLRLALGPGTRSIMQSLGWVIRTGADSTSTVPSTTPATLPTSSESPVVVMDTSTVPITTATMSSLSATGTTSAGPASVTGTTSAGPASVTGVGPSQKARRHRAIAYALW